MKFPLYLSLLLVVLTGCSPKRNDVTAVLPHPTLKASQPVRNFATSWQNETQYIVESIAADLAEMFRLARKSPAGESDECSVSAHEVFVAGTLTYQITIKSGSATITCDLPVKGPIWAPRTYDPLSAALSRHFSLDTSKKVADELSSTVIGALTTPTPTVLAQTDVELSGRLGSDLLNARLHEEAALLLGAFALREASGKFYEIRGELCRITAHLAFAQRLAGTEPPSDVGRLAEATLVSLYNNQLDALALLNVLPDTGDLGVWKRALRMRVTSDYRHYAESIHPTLLETREWFRARAKAISSDSAWAHRPVDPAQQSLSDWTRIAGEDSFTVSLGHAILREGLPAEIQEITLVYRMEVGRNLELSGVPSALNERPSVFAVKSGSSGHPLRIIGWGRWAAFLQRHLCHTLEVDFDFMHNKWGVPDEAVKFRDQADKFYWGLRLYPFVRRLNSTQEAYYHAAQDDARAVILQSPEIVPAQVWNYTCYTVPFCALYIPPPHAYINEWHLHNPPPGTAYDPLPRMNHPSLVGQADTVNRLGRLHAIAPYDTTITHNLLRIRDGQTQTAEKIAEAYKDVLDYNPKPCRRIAKLNEVQPVEFEKWMRRAIAIDPTDWDELAAFYEKNGQVQKAADAYVEWIKYEPDAVTVASKAAFLIDYFENNGRADEATALADRAADSYSYAGLLAKAKLLERRGNIDGAYDLQQKIKARYNSSGDLLGFLSRIQKNMPSTRYSKALSELLQESLPGGLVRFTASSAAPSRGVIVRAENSAIRDAGLRQGDIVVALRGYRIDNWTAYTAVRGLSSSEPLTLKIWRKGAYLDLPPLPASYRFGINLSDYRGP